MAWLTGLLRPMRCSGTRLRWRKISPEEIQIAPRDELLDSVVRCHAVLITQRSQVQIPPRYQEVPGQRPDRQDGGQAF